MKKPTKVVLAALLSLMLGLSACTSGDTPADTTAKATTSADGEKTDDAAKEGDAKDGAESEEGSNVGDELMQVNAQPRANLKQGGEVRLGIGSFPVNWNSMHVDGNLADQNAIMGYIAPTNWDFKGDGSFTPNTNWVLSYDVKEGDKQVVTMKLNPKAKWNDGTPITFEDYKAEWQACKGTDEPTEEPAEGEEADPSIFQCASTDGWNQVESIEKGADEFEVVTTFKSSLPDWSAPFSTTFHKAYMKDAESFNKSMRKFNGDYFTGPYKIDNIDDAQKIVTLVPNENWWGEKPFLDKIIFRLIESDQMGNAYVNKEIDSLAPIIDANTLNVVQGRGDGEVRSVPGLQWRHFTFNSQAESIKDVKLRQALVRGINREAIAKSDLAGMNLDIPELMTGSHLFAPGQVGYKDNSTDYAFDPERAGKELDELGWKLDGEYRKKDGKELEIKYLVITGVSTSENEGKMLQDQMKKIGVKITMDPTASADFFTKVIGHQFEITSFTWQGTPYPMNNIGQIYGSDSPSNFAQLNDPKLDEVIKKADTEPNVEKRIEYANEADKMVWDNVHTLPLYRRMDMNAVRKDLANFGAAGLGTTRPENLGYVK